MGVCELKYVKGADSTSLPVFNAARAAVQKDAVGWLHNHVLEEACVSLRPPLLVVVVR